MAQRLEELGIVVVPEHDALLGAEVAVDGRRADARLGGNLLHRDGLEAAPVEKSRAAAWTRRMASTRLSTRPSIPGFLDQM